MLRKIVVKFGGSNLKSPADVRRSASVATAYRRDYGRSLVVVVSAFSGVTDSLLKALDEAPGPLSRIDEYKSSLRRLHEDALDAQLSPPTDAEPATTARLAALRAAALDKIDRRLNELDRLLRGVHYLGSVPDFAKDAALACGERLSAPVMEAVLAGVGLDARELTPEEMGLVTDGTLGSASALIEESSSSIASALEEDGVFVVPGFYGVGEDGRMTVFGRGGSDYTAAVIARCIGAESLDLWKDVDGFLSGDPRVSDLAKTIPYLEYEEAAELAYFGAKVLHPRTVEPLEGLGIPIRVMNVERFTGTIEPFTIIGPAPQEERVQSTAIVKSVASTDDVAVVRLEGPGVGFRAGILARATGRLDAAGVNIASVITAQTSINLLFKRGDLDRATAALKAETTPGVVTVTPLSEVSMIAVVGSGMRERAGVASRVFGAIADAGINAILAQAGASPVASYVLVRSEDRKRGVKAIHDACIG